MAKFIISGFADEIDSNVIKQFEHINTLGISYFEPRGIDGKNISELNDEEVEILTEKMKKYNIKASSIGSPIGKIGINDDFEPHIEKLKRVIAIAKKLDAKYIRMFSFFIPEGENADNYRDEVLRRMTVMTKIAKEEGIILLHENEKDIYGDIKERCLDLVKTINSPNLRCVFDPANFVQCGENTIEAFNLLKEYVVYMHIKDSKENGDVVPAGSGNGNIKEIITALYKDGYEGFLSLEPHLGSFTGLNDLELDDKMLKLEESTPEKFTLAYDSLMKIVNEVI